MSLLSRVAERVYWSARYLERAENTARLVRVYGNLLLDLPRDAGLGWEQIVEIAGGEALSGAFGPGSENASAEFYLVADPRNASSILSCLRQARENIRTTRDIFPSEAWRCVNEHVIYARENLEAPGAARAPRSEVLADIIGGCQQLTGLLHGTMSQGTAYQFIRLGRNLERADMTTRIIDVAAATFLTGRSELLRFDNRLWMTVLQSLSSYQMYRQYVRRRIRGHDVIAYLLKDELFPRALSHCLGEVETALTRLPGHEEIKKSADELRARIASLEVEALEAEHLHLWIDEIQLALADLNDRVHARWLLPAMVE